MNCNILADDGVENVYLGRPWRPFAKTVFMKCNLEKQINPEGWKEWSNKGNESTAFYAEFKNTGEGSNTKDRISWSHQLSDMEAENYTIENILGSWALSYLK